MSIILFHTKFGALRLCGSVFVAQGWSVCERRIKMRHKNSLVQKGDGSHFKIGANLTILAHPLARNFTVFHLYTLQILC
jgi:hypothetical protein